MPQRNRRKRLVWPPRNGESSSTWTVSSVSVATFPTRPKKCVKCGGTEFYLWGGQLGFLWACAQCYPIPIEKAEAEA